MQFSVCIHISLCLVWMTLCIKSCPTAQFFHQHSALLCQLARAVNVHTCFHVHRGLAFLTDECQSQEKLSHFYYTLSTTSQVFKALTKTWCGGQGWGWELTVARLWPTHSCSHCSKQTPKGLCSSFSLECWLSFSVSLASTAFSKMFLYLSPRVINRTAIWASFVFSIRHDIPKMSWSNISWKSACWILGQSMLWADYLVSKPQLAGGTYSFGGLHSANMWGWHIHWHCIQRLGMARQPSLRGPSYFSHPEEKFCLQKWERHYRPKIRNDAWLKTQAAILRTQLHGALG